MTPKKRLGELLIDAGVIDATQLQAALGFQRQWGVRLGQALVDLKLASEPQHAPAVRAKPAPARRARRRTPPPHGGRGAAG